MDAGESMDQPRNDAAGGCRSSGNGAVALQLFFSLRSASFDRASEQTRRRYVPAAVPAATLPEMNCTADLPARSLPVPIVATTLSRLSRFASIESNSTVELGLAGALPLFLMVD